jgi:hypothetical protein
VQLGPAGNDIAHRFVRAHRGLAAPGGSFSHRRIAMDMPEARYFCPISPVGEYFD